jgi:hypothetical protein
MFGMLFVSICGVALPIVTGAWLAPASEGRSLAQAADGIVAAQARRRPSRAARVRPERLTTAAAPSAGHFGANLASGS